MEPFSKEKLVSVFESSQFRFCKEKKEKSSTAHFCYSKIFLEHEIPFKRNDSFLIETFILKKLESCQYLKMKKPLIWCGGEIPGWKNPFRFHKCNSQLDYKFIVQYRLILICINTGKRGKTFQ